jgi:zeta-carotene desaturase
LQQTTGAILSTFRKSGCSHSENVAPRKATLVKAHVVKEQRATFSAAPGTESLRPTAESGPPNVILAGDWTRSGWPATMEGAVRSGYLAAEAVARRAGTPALFLLPDLA